MSFYIGQRVKKVRGPFNVGVTGVYAGCLSLANDPHRDCYIRPDVPCVRYLAETDVPVGVIAPGQLSAATSSEWEPVLPPGLESLEEINALYEPIEVHA